MALERAYAGEDVPIQVSYSDDGAAVDSDDTDADGTPDAEVTITDNSDDTEVISAASMTHESTGVFEYVWDTDADANGPGAYEIEVAAEFDSETKIVRDFIRLE
jgi:hypothetical protein